MKLTVLVGLPASGKSTLSKRMIKEEKDTVRVNRDLLREMIHNGWRPQDEAGIVAVEQMVAEYYLGVEKRNVVVDDTNLTPKHKDLWETFAEKLRHKGLTDLELVFRQMNVDPFTCVERDLTRDNRVGASVIYQMAMENELMDKDIHYVLCDLDGTLCDIEHRRKYVKERPKDWKKFFQELPNDTLRTDVLAKVEKTVLDSINTGNKTYLILLSARPENYRVMTEEWLEKYGVKDYTALIMRRAGDSREDSIVKRELLHRYFKDKSKIIKVFDDRPRVIRMWREEGLDVEDVGNGEEF